MPVTEGTLGDASEVADKRNIAAVHPEQACNEGFVVGRIAGGHVSTQLSAISDQEKDSTQRREEAKAQGHNPKIVQKFLFGVNK
jgi:hypothetical protein